jgi:glycosyltransferase involved in cell wall biosynthesis
VNQNLISLEKYILKMPGKDVICHINLARGFRGGERQTELLVLGLSRLGWQQVLIARRGGELAARCQGIDGLTVRESSGSVIRAATRTSGCALVHVHQGRSLKAGFIANLIGAKPYIVTRRVQKSPRSTGLNRLMYRRAVKIVVVSRSIGQVLKLLDPVLEYEVIADASAGLESSEEAAAEIRNRFGGIVVVGHVGSLDDSHKGQKQIIDVARIFLSQNPDVIFVLVGSGRDEAELRALAADLSNVVFTGEVSNVGDYLRAFDLLLYPSRHEGLGSTILDAFEFGLPVVATRVGGIPEILDDADNGYLVEVDDIKAIVAALQKLIGDPELAQKIHSNNREKAQAYSADAMTEKYDRVYRSILDSGSGKG